MPAYGVGLVGCILRTVSRRVGGKRVFCLIVAYREFTPQSAWHVATDIKNLDTGQNVSNALLLIRDHARDVWVRLGEFRLGIHLGG